MNIIEVKLTVEDSCNPSNDDAIEYCIEMIYEVFAKEESQEHPRLKLILIEAKFKQ